MTYPKAYGVFVVTQIENDEIPYDLADFGAMAVETRDSDTMCASNAGTYVYIAGFEDETTRDKCADWVESNYKGAEVSRILMEDDGWSEGWKKFFKPVKLDTIEIITPWMDGDESIERTLVIDPGMAFGTGGHATTRLCLSFVEKFYLEKRLEDKVMDVGIGSGILSIACAMYGSTNVSGFDIDEEAVEAVKKNAVKNGVEDKIEVWCDTPQNVDGTWPLVLANIQLAVFLECAADVAKLVAKDGMLIVSGILKEQKDQLLSLWPDFELVELDELDGWLGFLLKRN